MNDKNHVALAPTNANEFSTEKEDLVYKLCVLLLFVNVTFYNWKRTFCLRMLHHGPTAAQNVRIGFVFSCVPP